MVKWLRESVAASWVLLIARVWLGWHWVTASLEKIGAPEWTGNQAGAAVAGFAKGGLAKAVGEHPEVQGWFASFLEGVVIPHSNIFSYMVAFGEFLVGITLIVGCVTTFAALMGALMNMMFLMAGTSSINPEMLVIAIILMVSGINSGKIGVDRLLLPWLKEKWQLLAHKNPKHIQEN